MITERQQQILAHFGGKAAFTHRQYMELLGSGNIHNDLGYLMDIGSDMFGCDVIESSALVIGTPSAPVTDFLEKLVKFLSGNRVWCCLHVLYSFLID